MIIGSRHTLITLIQFTTWKIIMCAEPGNGAAPLFSCALPLPKPVRPPLVVHEDEPEWALQSSLPSWPEEMSGGLAPSKSTICFQLSYFPDQQWLYWIFSKYGQVVKITIMKDKDIRKSNGLHLFWFWIKTAQNCTEAINNEQLFGSILKASIAIDNGRAA